MTNPTDIMIDASMNRDWEDLRMPEKIASLTATVPGAPPSLTLAIQELVRDVFNVSYWLGVKAGTGMLRDITERAIRDYYRAQASDAQVCEEIGKGESNGN